MYAVGAIVILLVVLAFGIPAFLFNESIKDLSAKKTTGDLSSKKPDPKNKS